jgi:hypothetical protein
MRRHSPHQDARSTARQFDLFTPASRAGAEEALPDWRTLPEQTRHTLMSLLTRLILETQPMINIRSQRKLRHDV